MFSLDDLSAWLRRNFAGNDPASAARTLTDQATQPPPPPDGSSPASALAAAMTGARPLRHGEQPASLKPTPVQRPGVAGSGGAFTPEWAAQAGLRMAAAGASPAPPAPLLAPQVHTPQQVPSLVESVFPEQPAPLTDQQRRLLQRFPSMLGSDR